MRVILSTVLALAAACAPGAALRAEMLQDPTFAGDGVATLTFDTGLPRTDTPVRVLRTADGKYVTVGSAAIGNGRIGIALARLLPNGDLDPAFQQRVKEACVTAVRDAVLDTSGRIVVVGDTDCTGHGATDVAVVRFLPGGQDDTGFAGDGGIGFAFATAPADDHGEGVVFDAATSSIIVGGSYKTPGGVRDIRFARIGLTGALQQVSALYSGSGDARIVRGLHVPADGHSHWLIENIGATGGEMGTLLRLSHATLGTSAGFGIAGYVPLGTFASPVGVNQACASPSALFTPTGLARFQDQIVAFGTTVTTGGSTRTQLVSMNQANAADYRSRCLNLIASVAIADGVPGHEGDTLYAAATFGKAPDSALALARLTPRADGAGLALDPTFHNGAPLSVVEAGAPPSPSRGIAIAADGSRYVVAGEQVFSGLDTDFIVARFADPMLFADGFE